MEGEKKVHKNLQTVLIIYRTTPLVSNNMPAELFFSQNHITKLDLLKPPIQIITKQQQTVNLGST